MRITAIFLLITCLSVAARGDSQGIHLKVKNTSLKQVLVQLEKQTSYTFTYSLSLLKDTRPVTLQLQNATIDEALKACLNNQPLTYSIIEKTIVLKQKAATPVKEDDINVLPPPPPPVNVKGRVLEEDGKPVVGASVQVKGNESKGTTTNSQGEFELTGISKDAVLVITGVNIETQTVNVAGKTFIEIISKLKVNELDEMIVVAYGKQKKASFTGSAKVLNSEVFAGLPRSSAIEAIQGNVPGVIASIGTGQPGELPNVRIRGIGSTTSAGPLYVVDGIPLEGASPVVINPNDIENMSILKDASAASLYGSRAANGVIIITTKQGANRKTVLNASFQQGFNKVTLRDEVLPLNTKEMLELLREGWVNSGRLATDFNKAMTDNGVDSTRDTDWFKELTRRGNYQQYNLSASGGNETTKFYVSGGHYRAKAALLGSDFYRSSLVARIFNQTTNKLSFDLNLKLSHRNSHEQSNAGSNGNPVRMYKRYQPWLKVYNADGTYDLSYANLYNPVAVVLENSDETNKFGLLGGLLAKYQLLKSLSVENQLNLDFDYRDEYDFKKSGIGTARTNGGEALYRTDRTTNVVNTTILRYNKQLGVHGISAFAGYESQQVHQQGNSIEKEKFVFNMFTLNNASANPDGGSYEQGNTLTSAFFNGSYNYNSKYYLSGSFRRDGSSRFGFKNRYGNFWSVGASWNVLAENFMNGQDIFSDLRIKTSYGVNGNQSLGNYEARALYGTGVDYMSSPGIILSSFGNAELTWEKNKPFNVGVDYGILRNRIRGTIEYYSRITESQLANLGISATNGLTSYRANIGNIKNSGVEFEINTVNVKASQRNGFEWTTGFNISTLKNKVLSLERTQEGDVRVSKIGDSYYRFNLRAYAGVDPQTGEALWYTDATKTTTTNIYNNAGRANYGTALPKYFGGLSNNLSWKGISLNFNIFFNFGNEIYDNWGANANSDGNRGFSATDAMPRYVYDNRWQKPGDITNVPKIVYLGTQSGSSSYSSSRFLYKGDYVRLRDITLAYSIPVGWAKSIGVKDTRFYVRASNLYTWTKDKRMNFDPEVGIEGETDQNAPIYKTLLLGIDIRF